MNNEIFLINVTGRDRPGLVSSVNNILAQSDVDVLDISQSVIHEHIALGILIKIPQEHQATAILKDLLLLGHDLALNVRFNLITSDEYERWVTEQRQERRIITLIGRKLTARQIAEVSAVVAEHGLNIDVITRLSSRASLDKPAPLPKACVQMTVSGKLSDPNRLRGQLLEISHHAEIDIAFYVDDIYRRNRRLVAFDMDSTLIQVEVINELAKAAGVGDEVAAITESAMRGEIDFTESLTRRVALLEGLSAHVLAEIAENLPLTEGVELLAATLKRLGYKLAILSGGFLLFGRHLQQKLNFDYAYANDLEIVDGKLTGRLQGEIVDGPKKAALLKQIAHQEDLRL